MKYIIGIISLFGIILPNKNNIEYIEITCKNNESYSCSISGYSDYQISALDIIYELDKEHKVKVDDIWQGEEYESKIMLYTDVNKLGLFNIAEILSEENIKENDFKIKKIIFYDDLFEEHIIFDSVKNNANNNNLTFTKIIKIIICVIIILGIICSSLVYLFKKGVIHNEK